MGLRPHSREWYDRLATQGKGYGSTTENVNVDPYGGEEIYLKLVREHLSQTKDVLDAGCGHGDVPIELAPLCRTITGYDRVKGFIDLARENARKHQVANATFICADSAAASNNGHPRIPVEDNSIDLIMSRRGPVSWIADAKRVVRSGGALIQLCMLGRTPVPAWNARLPEPLQTQGKWANSHLPDSMLAPVQAALESAEIELHSHWTFDVPAMVDHPRSLYRSLTVGRDPDEIPPYEDVSDSFMGIFTKFGRNGRIDVRQRRLLWKAVVD